ncbi:MAG TPA: uroporphyrinogen-III C-methyltransferase [Candidatus Hydrogenedentes bacterium]|nr:uroporphyrinogen-III C-methyltransferase [Candidatus Hydrogenedentota bacterium]HOK88701.1 uroporphyrinogen-III C-methyltransferase [Candidatus Hydrogenedentota bacterium]HOV61402.1 uroporphyrinogen-III C-methyltransferase [Candidatus Hydrogenedentota bacterium]
MTDRESQTPSSPGAPKGKVYIVGAGPGDPGLITARGRECLAMADAVVYDHLVHPELLSLCSGAEQIYVGKRSAKHSLPQEEINTLLIALAARYRFIVRLKGGDPFIFGRGGEEALALAEAGIPWEIVPGVTSGYAAPAYAGIPVTHRGLSSAAVFVTVHDEASLARLETLLGGWHPEITLVCFMAARRARVLADCLARRGVPESFPVACVRWGTWGIQETLVTTVAGLRNLSPDAFEPPALLIVGQTVTLRDQLNWFEQRPLHGVRVVLTHSESRVGPLESRLRAMGAEIFLFPVFRLEAIQTSREDSALNPYDWLVLTSVNAARFLVETLEQQQRDLRSFANLRIAAVGEATCQAARDAHLYPDVTPKDYDGKELVRLMAERDVSGSIGGRRVLLPCSDLSRASIAQALRDAGAEVTERVSYRVVPMPDDAERLAALTRFHPHLVLFTNAKAVRAFHALTHQRFTRACPGTVFGVLGPVTAAAARECGYQPALEPATRTVDALVDAVVRYVRENSPLRGT